MENKINIFSPVDGVVKNLKSLNDGVFSEGMLGDGFYIEPTSNEFYSPFKEGRLLQIFDTKHAYYFQGPSGPTILMHIGLETVGLQGKPFKVLAKEKDQLQENKKICEVDFKMLEEAKVKKSTIIVLDSVESAGWSFKLLKTGEVKQGELIGEFSITKKVVDDSYLSDINQIIEAKNKHEIAAEKIYDLVGGKNNYTNVFNCMTRLRFEIKDKKLVNEEAIKNLSISKGVLWSGNQLQIIIGGEVYKVKDALLIYVENLANGNVKSNSELKTQYVSIGKKIMMAFSAIILPSLPIMMASGLLMGIKTILIMTGTIQNMGIGAGGPINIDVNALSVFVNVAAETGLKLLGIYIGYSTIKWLKGPEMLQIAISIMIAGATIGLGLAPNLKLWSTTIGGHEFALKFSFYTSSIIPHIASAFIVSYLDKWIKTWMPVSIDVLFRPLLIILVTFGAIFFVFGPILFIVEQILTLIMGLLSKIPFGIGTAIFAMAWQPLVLTGMHVSLIMPIVIGIQQGTPSTLMSILNIAVFAQVGAAIGVALKTKNKISKLAIISALPGGIVGVTEPIIYGTNLPKLRPFIIGIISAGIVALVSGMLAVESRTSGGLGIFAFTATLVEPFKSSSINIFTNHANSAITNTVLWFVLNLGVLPIAAVFSFFVYVDRISENKGIKRVNSKVVSIIANVKKAKAKDIKLEYKTQLDKLSNLFDEKELKRIQEIEKELIKITSASVKSDRLEASQEKKLSAIVKKARKLQLKKMDEVEKHNQQDLLVKKHNEIKNDKLVKEANSQLEALNIKNENNMNWLNTLVDNKLKEIELILNEISKKSNIEFIKNGKNSYENAIRSLEVAYEVINNKETNFSKKGYKKSLILK